MPKGNLTGLMPKQPIFEGAQNLYVSAGNQILFALLTILRGKSILSRCLEYQKQNVSGCNSLKTSIVYIGFYDQPPSQQSGLLNLIAVAKLS